MYKLGIALFKSDRFNKSKCSNGIFPSNIEHTTPAIESVNNSISPKDDISNFHSSKCRECLSFLHLSYKSYDNWCSIFIFSIRMLFLFSNSSNPDFSRFFRKRFIRKYPYPHLSASFYMPCHCDTCGLNLL